MKIVADENIPLAKEFFSHLGDVVTLPGRSMQPVDVRDADALIVRSITAVNGALLAESSVAFVGTCTIGIDHLDQAFLQQQGIRYNSAPGCNANSVVEYVFSALCALDQPWQGQTFGIIGCGNVGGHLYRRLKMLGIDCLCYDPFLSDDPSLSGVNNVDLCSLEEVLAADIISLHTPLTESGKYPTWHLLGEKELASLKPNTLLLNCGRGPVIDNLALLAVLEGRSDLRIVLDVWEPEPDINIELLNKVALGTPHIAGYSFDGKVKGTEMIYRALCDSLNIHPKHKTQVLLPTIKGAVIELQSPGSDWEAVCQSVLQAYDIREDDKRLRSIAAEPESIGSSFDALRKNYHQRREFFNYRVESESERGVSSYYLSKNKPLNEHLAALGFAQ